MTREDAAHRIIDDGQQIVDSSRRIMENMHQIYDSAQLQHSFKQAYRDNPYVLLAAAAGVGYVLGGGLLSPFSRRLFRVGLKGLILPIAGAQLKQSGAPMPDAQPSFLSGQ